MGILTRWQHPWLKGAAAVGAIALAGAAAHADKPVHKAEKTADKATLARGEYLVKTTGCNECHTPMVFDKELGMPVPDMSRMLSGHPEKAPDPASTLAHGDQGVIGPTFTAFKLPFGVVYSPNLTPDPATGIGNWTAEMFIGALRTGRHMGGTGRPILPPMPWPSLANLSDTDLKAMFAYLLSLPPIRNEVPEAKVSPQAIAEISASYTKLQQRMRQKAAAHH